MEKKFEVVFTEGKALHYLCRISLKAKHFIIYAVCKIGFND